MTRGRLTALLVVAVSLLVDAGPARADERDECAAAYERTQRARQRSELATAADAAQRCARASCPAILRDECTQWVDEIRKKQPRFVIRVRDGEGCPRDDAHIDVAGVSAREDGDFVVDPGRHAVVVHDPSSPRTKSLSIDLTPGERRDIDVDFGAANAVCRRSPPFSTLTVGLGATGAGLVAVGVTLGIIGAAKRGGLDDCRPNCSASRLDTVRPFFVSGDVLGGLGILFLGAAAVTYFTHWPSARVSSNGLFLQF